MLKVESSGRFNRKKTNKKLLPLRITEKILCMNIEDIRTYCLSKPPVTESFPFDNETLVFKVGSKMFALLSLESVPLRINLKCNPEKAEKLREEFSQISPGYHMNKKHWNTIVIDGMLSPDFIKEQIDHSYTLVINSLTKKERLELGIN